MLMSQAPRSGWPGRCGRPSSGSGAAQGFTTIELLVGLVILAILASLALPSYLQHLRRLKRSEALTAMALIQQAQERRRAELPTFTAILGSGGLELASSTPNGLYLLATATPLGREATQYSVTATAQGSQVSDLPCTHLRLDVDAGTLTYRSGGSTLYGNDAGANRRCWNQ